MGENCIVAIAAIDGPKKHTIAQEDANGDILVATVRETDGHYGNISTIVLIPEICVTLLELRSKIWTPTLATGGVAKEIRTVVKLSSTWVGRYLDLMNKMKLPGDVVLGFKVDFLNAYGRQSYLHC